MRTCAYHPGQPCVGLCQVCQRPLCRACDHRIRGFPCCESCIVAGVDLLQRSRQYDPHHLSLDNRSGSPEVGRLIPGLALLFSLFPGLGAVYNRQFVKALTIFTLTAGLEALSSNLSGSLERLCGLSAAAIYLFSMLDAYRSARRSRQGYDLASEGVRVRSLLQRNSTLLAISLSIAGVLVLVNSLWPAAAERFWPALLILAAVLIKWRHNLRREVLDSK